MDVDAVGTDVATADEAICELLETHLRLSRDDARRAFDAPPPATKTARGSSEPKRGTAPAVKGADVTVEASSVGPARCWNSASRSRLSRAKPC